MCRYSAHDQNRTASFKTNSMTFTQKPALCLTPKLKRDFLWIVNGYLLSRTRLCRVFKSSNLPHCWQLARCFFSWFQAVARASL